MRPIVIYETESYKERSKRSMEEIQEETRRIFGEPEDVDKEITDHISRLSSTLESTAKMIREKGDESMLKHFLAIVHNWADRCALHKEMTEIINYW